MIRFTVLSNELREPLTDTPLPLSKTFSLGPEDSLQKKTAAQLMQGRAERCEVRDVAEFALMLSLVVGPHQALAYGVTEQLVSRVVTQKELRNKPGAIARDRKHFRYPAGPAILFLDYDPPPGATAPLSAEQIRTRLLDACSELGAAPMVAMASTSAYIYKGDQALQSARGWHLYVAIADGADIERAGKALYECLWLAGHGRYDISGAGSLLDRNLIDGSVWQPERLDFTAAHCIEPLTQRRPAPQIWNPNAPLLDTRLIVDPTTEQKAAIAQKRTQTGAAIEPERRKVRDAWVTERQYALQASGVDPIIAQRTAEYAADSGILLGDFSLWTEDGRAVTVGQVLADRKQYHGARFADPLEPEYRGDNRIAHATLFDGRPRIYSHAHGGRAFYLYPQSRSLKLQKGELPRLADDAVAIIREFHDLYDQPRGKGEYRIVQISEGHIVPVTDACLRTYIGRLFRCERFSIRNHEFEPADVPKDLIEAISSNTTARRLPILEAVVRDPTLRSDGTVFDTPGYSARDRAFYESDCEDPL